jgi:cell division septation protein DedD
MDEFIEEVQEEVQDIQRDVGEATLRLADAALNSIARTGREIEASIDTDKDGSLLDNQLSNIAGDIPIAGETWAHIGEQVGDFATDVMGTRKGGLFSKEGTLERERTTDDDYLGDGTLQGGFGQTVNETIGLGDQQDPAAWLIGAGAATAPMGGSVATGIGVVAEAVREREDPLDDNAVEFRPSGGPSFASKPGPPKPSESDKPPDAVKPTAAGPADVGTTAKVPKPGS